jgi:hypothetical protein
MSLVCAWVVGLDDECEDRFDDTFASFGPLNFGGVFERLSCSRDVKGALARADELLPFGEESRADFKGRRSRSSLS